MRSIYSSEMSTVKVAAVARPRKTVRHTVAMARNTMMRSYHQPLDWRSGPARSGGLSAVFAVWLGLFASSPMIFGCGARGGVGRADPPAVVDPLLRDRYDDAVDAFESDRPSDARGRFEALRSEAAGTELVPYIDLYLGRLSVRDDAGRGSDRLLELAKATDDAQVRRLARFHGGLAAVDAHRCITARKVLGPLKAELGAAERGQMALALARCEAGLDALVQLDAAARADSRWEEPARATATETLREMPLADVRRAIARLGEGPLSTTLYRRLAIIARDRGDQRLLAEARRALPADDPLVAGTRAAVERGRVGVVLPLSGRARPVGQSIAGLVKRLGASEDRPSDAPDLRVRDGGDPSKAAASIRALAEQDGVFAAVGMFDRSTASRAAEAAAAVGLPLIMMTLDDAAVTSDGPTWRALHTPTLVARVAAGAGQARGGRVAVVLRPSSQYGKAHAKLFARAWKGGGGKVLGEVAWSRKKKNWARVAEQLDGLEFDTLFIPADPVAAAEMMRHLAAAGVWARTSKGRFRDEEGNREVWVIGTPEWYRPDLIRLGGRYVEGVMVPVPFAVETAEGAALKAQVAPLGGRAPTTFDAVLVDTLRALTKAWAIHRDEGAPISEAIGDQTVEGGATAGLRFAERDALSTLFLLTIEGGVFRPLTEPGDG